MASKEELKVEGKFTLSNQLPARDYKYSIRVREGRMSMWLQEAGDISCRQWYKSGVEKADYVASTDGIDLSATDTVECFREALESQSSDDVSREIAPLEGGGLRLELLLTIRFLSKTWVMKYKLDLDPVGKERFDSMALRLSDQESQLKRMKERESELEWKLEELRRGFVAPSIQLRASEVNSRSRLQWSKSESVDFIVNGQDGMINIRESGVYTVRVAVRGIFKALSAVSLWKNGSVLRQFKPVAELFGSTTTTRWALATYIQEGETLAIKCHDCHLSGTSYLSITRLSTEPMDLCNSR